MKDGEITTTAFVTKRMRWEETIVEEKYVSLQLPYDVAVSLHTMVRKVAGSPKTSYRAHSDAISDAMKRARVAYDDTRFLGGLAAERIRCP